MENHQFPPMAGRSKGSFHVCRHQDAKTEVEWFSLGNQQVTGKGLKASFTLGLMLDEVFLCSVVSLGVKRFFLHLWYYCVPAGCNIKWISLPWTWVKESERARCAVAFLCLLRAKPWARQSRNQVGRWPAGPDNRLLPSAENTCWMRILPGLGS